MKFFGKNNKIMKLTNKLCYQTSFDRIGRITKSREDSVATNSLIKNI